MRYPIHDRRTGAVLAEPEIECPTDAARGVKLGLAVKAALDAGADLRGADLTWAALGGADMGGADLGGADLRGADLTRADLGVAALGGADLGGADLGGADLGRADLTRACLRGACLRGADLGSADLRWSDLRGASLGGADFDMADLGGADLRGADLTRASLARAFLGGASLGGATLRGADLVWTRWGDGAKWEEGVPVTVEPIVLCLPDMQFTIVVLDRHVAVGCQLLELAAWAAMGEEQIDEMGGEHAVDLWRRWRDPVLAIATAGGRPLPETPPSAETAP